MLTLNKRIFKKIFLLIIFFCFIFAGFTTAVVKPTSDFYVNDYANLLNEETKQYIININKDLNSKTGAQIVVVTIPSLEGEQIEEYANKLFREFGIGNKTKNNGLLLLLALEERQFRVEVGYGLEGILPDAKTGRIQDEYIIPYLKENNWNEGIKNGFNAFLDVVVKEYNINIEKEEPTKGKQKSEAYSIILLFYISLIFGSIFSKKNKMNSKLLIWPVFLGYAVVLGIITYIVVHIPLIFSFILGLIGSIIGYFSPNGWFFFDRWKIWRRF